MSGLKGILRSDKAYTLAGTGLSAFTGLLSFTLLARMLPKEELGAWFIFLTVYGFFDMLRTGLILNGLINRIAASIEKAQQQLYFGASWRIAVIATVAAGILIPAVCFLLLRIYPSDSLRLIATWFPLVALCSLPHALSSYFLNATADFKKLAVVRLIQQVSFAAVIIAFFFSGGVSLPHLFVYYVASHLLASLLAIGIRWSHMGSILRSRQKETLELYHYGKYSMGTLICSNLLRSSDVFLIGWLLGPAAVAIFSIPQRLIEIIEVPLRSFIVTSIPQMSRQHASGNREGLAASFEKNAGFMLIALIPVVLFCFVAAEYLVQLLGGAGFEDSVILLRIFCIYLLFLPLERYTGVGLDVMNLPHLNLVKVIIMLAVNVVGDIAVLKLTGSLELAAAVTILTFSTGIVFGFASMKKLLPVSVRGVFTNGWGELNRLAGILKK